MEPRARVSVWPGRRRVPGIVAPDSWGARGAECLPRDVLRRSSPATSSCDGTTARRCLCHGTGSGTTEARPPASSVPPAPHGGLGGLSRHPANSGPDFRSSSSSSFLPEEIRCPRKSGVSSSFLPVEIRCQFIILAQNEIRCRFIILARKDEPAPDYAPEDMLGLEESQGQGPLSTCLCLKGVTMRRLFTLEYWRDGDWYVGRLDGSSRCAQPGRKPR